MCNLLDKITLAPCPFCGGDAHFYGENRGWTIECKRCSVKMNIVCSPMSIKKVWSKRDNRAVIDECIEMIEDEMHEDLPSYDSLIMKFNKLRDA